MEELVEMDNSVEAVTYLALTMLYANKSDARQVLLPDLIHIMDIEHIFRLVHAYGGRTLVIPTMSQLKDDMFTVMYFYCVEVLGMSLEEFCDKFMANKPSPGYIRSLKKKRSKWIRFMRKNNLVVPKQFLKSNSQIIKDLQAILKGYCTIGGKNGQEESSKVVIIKGKETDKTEKTKKTNSRTKRGKSKRVRGSNKQHRRTNGTNRGKRGRGK